VPSPPAVGRVSPTFEGRHLPGNSISYNPALAGGSNAIRSIEAAGVHHAARWRGGSVAARSARAVSRRRNTLLISEESGLVQSVRVKSKSTSEEQVGGAVNETAKVTRLSTTKVSGEYDHHLPHRLLPPNLHPTIERDKARFSKAKRKSAYGEANRDRQDQTQNRASHIGGTTPQEHRRSVECKFPVRKIPCSIT
jgi:hypothetical protein